MTTCPRTTPEKIRPTPKPTPRPRPRSTQAPVTPDAAEMPIGVRVEGTSSVVRFRSSVPLMTTARASNGEGCGHDREMFGDDAGPEATVPDSDEQVGWSNRQRAGQVHCVGASQRVP